MRKLHNYLIFCQWSAPEERNLFLYLLYFPVDNLLPPPIDFLQSIKINIYGLPTKRKNSNYSLNGQKINTFTPLKKVGNSNQTHTIDMSGLNNGHYIIVLDLLKGDNNVTSVRKRIVIER